MNDAERKLVYQKLGHKLWHKLNIANSAWYSKN